MHPLLIRTRPRMTSSTTLRTPQAAVRPRKAPQLMQRQRKAFYYFNAGRHTALSFQILLSQLKDPKVSAQYVGMRDFLCAGMETLLASIRPGIDDDEQSRQYFMALLRMHLSHLTVDEGEQLSQTLKAAQFSCNVVETIIDDEVYRDYGFANGPPHSFNRTLIQTQEFFNFLDDLKDGIREFPRIPLHPDVSASAREILKASSMAWQQPDQTFDNLQHCVHLMAKAIDVPLKGIDITTAPIEEKSTTVAATQNAIIISSPHAEAVLVDHTGRLFAELLRDVLELLLTQKLFGITAPPDKLTRTQQRQLSDAMAQIYSSVPASGDSDLKVRARAVLKEASHFGEIQIQPTTGVALGHAWIAPALSLVPDKRRQSVDLGHRFMHSGFHLQAGDSPIREWPAYFMTAKEIEESYPYQHARSVRVPVDAQRLQAAAAEVRREWESQNVPYRFIGTRPDMRATGCRVTVWEAVQRGMSDDARTLFRHYNGGLPEPQSPTELWHRLNGLMRWMETLATE